MKLWDHSEELFERELKERLRLGGKLDEKDATPDLLWLEKWTDHVMSAIETIETSKNSKKHCRKQTNKSL